MRAEFLCANPLHCRAFERAWFPGSKFTAKELQPDAAFRVMVLDHLHSGANGNFHAEFLAQFTAQAFLEALARLPLASRKLPQSREMRALGPLGNQEPAVAENEPGGDLDEPCGRWR